MAGGNTNDQHHRHQELRLIFARWGLPEQLISDNGPQFVSEEFAEFSRTNGIKNIRVAPYHPSSNGAAKRFVQTFKKAMKTMAREGDQIKRLANFLLSYRKTPQTTTMEAPAMLLMKRIPRSRPSLTTRTSRQLRKKPMINMQNSLSSNPIKKFGSETIKAQTSGHQEK